MADITIQLTGVKAQCQAGTLTPDIVLPPHKRSRRELMFRANPHCFWCGTVTALRREKPIALPDSATVDHLYSKLHPERKINRSYVLACYACNNERGKADYLGRVFVPKLPERRELARLISVAAAVSCSTDT